MSLLVKRDRIRKLLKLKRWLAESDKALAREVGVSPMVVERERRKLIHAGLIPPGYGWDNARKVCDPDRPRYQPYAPARGGYVWTPEGATVRLDKLPAKVRRLAGSAAPPRPA